MDINNKKVAKNIIKLAMCISKCSRADFDLLFAMCIVKDQATIDKESNKHYDEFCNLVDQIRNNPHICALLGIKDKD